jgi:hypothetical protein
MVEMLKRCGAHVTRQCVMDQAVHLHDLRVAMLRSGITGGHRLVPTGSPIAAE